MVELRLIKSQTTHLHFLPGRKISTRSLWHAFYKARLDLQVQLWLEGRSLIYGYLRSMCFSIIILLILLELFFVGVDYRCLFLPWWPLEGQDSDLYILAGLKWTPSWNGNGYSGSIWCKWYHGWLTKLVTKKDSLDLGSVQYIFCYFHSSWEKRVRRLFWQEWQRNSEKRLEIIGIVREWKMNEKALPTWFSYHVLGQFASWSFNTHQCLDWKRSRSHVYRVGSCQL